MRKSALSLLLAFAMLAGTFGNLQFANAAESSADLKDLLFDRMYVLTQKGTETEGFDPDVLEYTGTVYRSFDQLQVYPIKADNNASVKVNGTALTGNYANIDVAAAGNHDVTIEVTSGDLTKTYKVAITKVETDYRGRAPLTYKTDFTVSSDFCDDQNSLDKMFDGNRSTIWAPDEMPAADEDAGELTSFVIDLKKTKQISRIDAYFAHEYKLWKNMAQISVSTDGETWKTVIDQGNMRADQYCVQYEFGVSHEARYVKWEAKLFVGDYNGSGDNVDNLKIQELIVYEDPEGYPEAQEPDDIMSQPWTHEDRHENIESGQATVIERGFPFSGWMPSGGYGRGVPTADETAGFGFDGPLFYDPPFQNPDFMNYNPTAFWGIAKAPFGGNGMGSAGEPRAFIDESMLPYIRNAISFCFGDEGGYSLDEAKRFRDWFAWTKENYPGVIVHSNQYGGQWGKSSLSEYIRVAHPDLISWDTYYNSSNGNISNTLDGTWKTYRELALKGVDGTGNKPILYGSYVDVYNNDQPASYKNLIGNLSALTGQKWLNFFRVEFQFDHCFLWDQDGTPTRATSEWGNVLHGVKNISNQLTRLNSDWVVTKPGVNSSAATGWQMGDFAGNTAVNSEYLISDVNATNVGGARNGNRGDVVLGYFNPMPGLGEEEIAEYFNGATAPKAFMLLNGLTSGSSGHWNEPNVLGKETGSEENTRQEITVTVGANHPDLYRVRNDTKMGDTAHKFEKVTINEDNQFTVSLGGGQANLYFWDMDSTAEDSADSAEGHPASFAFDDNANTYWQAAGAVTSSAPIQLSNTFASINMNKVVINEFGSHVTGYKVQYQNETDQWTDLPGASGTSIGDSKVFDLAEAVTAKGIRIVISSSNGAPAIQDVRVYGEENSDAEKTLTVNDNTMGSGLNRFQYDDKWSYREAEGSQGLAGLEENDVHFSNLADSHATFTFYGTKAEIKFRNNGTHQYKLQLDKETEVDFSTNGSGGTASKTFTGLEQKKHILKITKVQAGQAAIDCAVVTYTGAIPDDAADATVETYVDDSVTAAAQQNHFTFTPTDASEANGWKHSAQTDSTNCGWTATSKASASYTLNFYGTKALVYMGEGFSGADKVYQNVTFQLDGKALSDVAIKNINYPNAGGTKSNTDGNNNISRQAFVIDTKAVANGNHTLIVTGTGKNRVDYAVVSKLAEKNEEPNVGYQVSITSGGNGNGALAGGGSSVNAHEDAVITLTPSEGYRCTEATVNGYKYEVRDNKLIVYDVTSDLNINLTFALVPPDTVSKEVLNELLTECKALERFDYTGGTWAAIQTTLPAAQKVYDKAGATDEEVKTAYDDLWSAKNGLKPIGDGLVPEETDTKKFVDNPDPSIVYSNGWANGDGGGADNKYLQSQEWMNDAVGATIRYSFTGTGIEVINGRNTTLANMNVTLKQGDTVVDTKNGIVSAGEPGHFSAYTKTDLPYGDYTIELSFTAGASGNKGEFDGFFVYNTGKPQSYTVTFDLDPEDADVVVTNSLGQPVAAQADGSYLLTAGDYHYEVSAEGYQTQSDDFTVSKAATVSVTLVKTVVPPQKYDIQIEETENGSVTASAANSPAGETITLTIAPKADYALLDGSLKVTAANGSAVTLTKVSDTSYQFTMPGSNVSVAAGFKKIPVIDDTVTLKDEATGITVTGKDGALNSDMELVVTPITSGAQFELAQKTLKDLEGNHSYWDISLLADGVKVQPDGVITVSVPIPDGYDASRILLYRVNDDGSRDKLGFTVKDGKIVFDTKHLSLYAIVETKEEGGGDVPKTGISSVSTAISTAILLLGSGAVACFLTKKRRKEDE